MNMLFGKVVLVSGGVGASVPQLPACLQRKAQK
jgi:hypothetical protein